MAAKQAKARKTPAKRKKPASPTAAQHLARLRSSGEVVSVHGPFGARTMIDISTDAARAILPELQRPDGVTDGVEAELAACKDAPPALAATAIALAREMDNPYNSATSKGQCAKALNETMEQIRAAGADAPTSDGLDEIAKAREQRRAGSAA